MVDYMAKAKCHSCPKDVYQVPAPSVTPDFVHTLQFDEVLWPWEIHEHQRLRHNPWCGRVVSLAEECRKSNHPEPRLVTIVSVRPWKLIGKNRLECMNWRCKGPRWSCDPWYLVALKTVSGKRSCGVFVGSGELGAYDLGAGDLAVLCGEGAHQKLIINSSKNHVLHWDSVDWDGEGLRWNLHGNLYLPLHWLEDVSGVVVEPERSFSNV
jgi:hypothetical protein